ncbi:MAG: ATP-binding protein [bacterium]
MSIGNRLLINLLILLALAASLYGFFFLRQEQNYAESQARERIQAFGESMREILQANLSSEDLGPLKKFLNRLAVFQQPLGMRVVLKPGELFFQSKSLKSLPQEGFDKLAGALNNQDSSLEEVSFEGKSYLVSNWPLLSKAGHFLGILQIWDYRSTFDAAVRAYQRKVFSALTLFYSLTLAIIFFAVQRNVNRPMAHLLEEVRGASPNSAAKGHEVSLLKREFRERDSHLHELKHLISQSSREKEALLDQLKQSEKLVAIGKFAAGLAHEMGGPLSVIEGRSAQALRKAEDPALLKKNLELIAAQAKHMSAMIQDVLLFARRRPLRRVPIDLKNLCHQAIELFEGAAPGIQMEIQSDGDLPKLEVDPDQMLQVLTNLLRNAIQAMPKGGRLVLGLQRFATGEGARLPWVHLSVEDSGMGMDEEVRARLFEPFFSRRAGLAGTGLGLSIVYGIVEEHGGKILVQSSPGRGSRFDVYLPLEADLKPAAGKTVSAPPLTRAYPEEKNA